MEKVGVLIETKDGQLKKSNFGTITAAWDADCELCALVLDGAAPAYKEQLEQYGIRQIIDIAGPEGPLPWNPEVWTKAVIQAMDQFALQHLVGPTSAWGKDLLPRIAAALDAPLALDCTAIRIRDRLARKSRFSGKITAEIKLHGSHCIYGIRPNAVSAERHAENARILSCRVTAIPDRLQICEIKEGIFRGLDLAEAEIIISGGRAMGKSENFSLIRQCAEAMGAAVGASRAAVDAGYAPYSMQVGQTGATVSPKLYIACGISGAIQHFAGMKTSGTIVAINKDPDAPMVRNCDYGIVGDLFEIVPLLTRQLKKALGA